MKRFFCLLFLAVSFISFSQTVNKTLLTNEVFKAIYGNGADPDDYPAANYPAVYTDLQGNGDFEKKGRLLIYLEFKDGIPVLRRNLCSFNITSIPFKVSVIKTLLEAYKVPLVTSGVSLPYNDVTQNTLYYYHVLTAYDIGMIPNTSSLDPEDSITLNDLENYIDFLENSSQVDPPNQSELKDAENYFNPGIYNPETLGQFHGIEQGVFSHYAKNSFVIPDRKMNLNFSHFYSNAMVEIPEDYYAIKPLARGWSHTYNSYIIQENNVGQDNTDYYYIVWPDGTIHIYNKDDNEYVTLGVYDEVDEGSSTIYITKKNQVRYKYQKLDSGRLLYYLTEIRDPNGNEINIDYQNAEQDDTKRIQYVEAPSGKKLQFEYLNNTDLIKKIEDPIDRDIEFEYSGVSSSWAFNYPVLVAFEDAKGNNTTYQYDTSNPYEQYLLKRIDLPRGNQIKASYNNSGKLRQYQVDDDDPVSVDLHFDYDTNNFTSEVTTPTPSGNSLSHNYTFNENGSVTTYNSDIDNLIVEYPNSTVDVFLPDNTSLNGIDIEYDYDSNGNVTKIDKENGDVVEEFDYDNDNNLTEYTDPNGNVTKFFYDSDENLTRVEDALGNSINYNYDTYGQLTSVINQEGIQINYTYENDGAVSSITAPANIESTFTYDDINRLLGRIDNGLASQYNYDKNDNITSITNSGNFTTSYNYDQNDNLASITNANNISTSFTYDDQDRVTKEEFGNLTKRYEYGDEGFLEEYTKPSGADIDYDYDNDGRLKETGTITDIDYNSKNLLEDVTNANGTVTFKYDNLNLVERVTTTHGFRVEYDYEDTGKLDDIEYPTINGVELKVYYVYDDKNRVTKIGLTRNVGQDGLILADYKHLKDDRIAHIDLGNNFRIDYGYDDAGRLNYLSHDNLSSGASIYIGDFTINNRGNITKALERLPVFSSTSNSNNVSGDYSYNQNNHITNGSGTSYSVNSDGNTTSIGSGISINYDIDDRLTSYSDIDNDFLFKYNSFGQRIEVSKDGVATKFVRDVLKDNILVELDQNNNPIYYYIYHTNRTLIARMKPNGDLHYYHGDIRGSTIAITDESREITHKYRYDDFGSIINIVEPNNDSNRFRYVGTYGVEYDTEDLFYMRARYYKPSIGRFLTEDPIWHTNLYPYADNNPISRIDSNGKDSSLVSIYDPPAEDPSIDTFFYGYTVTVVPPIGFDNSGNIEPFTGFNLGMHNNFIINDSSPDSTPTVTYGENKGFDFGVTLDLGFCRDWVNSDFSEADFDSNKTRGFTVGFGGVGYSYQRSSTQDGRVIKCHSILLGPDLGFSINTNKTRRLFDD